MRLRGKHCGNDVVRLHNGYLLACAQTIYFFYSVPEAHSSEGALLMEDPGPEHAKK